MRPLYEINEEYQAIYDTVENYCIENGGELPPELEAQLNAIQGERDQKIKGIGLMFKNSEAYEEALDLEIKRLIKRRDAERSLQDRLKIILTSNLEMGEKVKDPQLSITWRPSEKVVILDEDSVPLDLCKTKVEVSVSAVKDYLKSLELKEDVEPCKFATLEKRNNIQIK